MSRWSAESDYDFHEQAGTDGPDPLLDCTRCHRRFAGQVGASAMLCNECYAQALETQERLNQQVIDARDQKVSA